jgi:hypothetical protein
MQQSGGQAEPRLFLLEPANSLTRETRRESGGRERTAAAVSRAALAVGARRPGVGRTEVSGDAEVLAQQLELLHLQPRLL